MLLRLQLFSAAECVSLLPDHVGLAYLAMVPRPMVGRGRVTPSVVGYPGCLLFWSTEYST